MFVGVSIWTKYELWPWLLILKQSSVSALLLFFGFQVTQCQVSSLFRYYYRSCLVCIFWMPVFELFWTSLVSRFVYGDCTKFHQVLSMPNFLLTMVLLQYYKRDCSSGMNLVVSLFLGSLEECHCRFLHYFWSFQFLVPVIKFFQSWNHWR